MSRLISQGKRQNLTMPAFGVGSVTWAPAVALAAFVANVTALWLSQRFVLPKEKEKGLLSVALLALIGAVLNVILVKLIPVIGFLVAIVVWIWLIKVWFDIGWGQAIVIAVVAFVLGIVLSAIVGLLLGISLLLPLLG